jgi:hypothetical protein
MKLWAATSGGGGRLSRDRGRCGTR